MGEREQATAAHKDRGRKDARRVAVYARFSSPLQNPLSIEDQVQLCSERARAMRGVVVALYTDAAFTGTTLHGREGLLEMLEHAQARRFDTIIAEALDRLSRNQADMAGLYRELRYRDIELHTVEEGEIDAMHIGFKGVINESFVASLAAKTRRGQAAQIRKGRMMTIAYGYRPANRIEADGVTVARGLREIVHEEAETVRRIFRLYDKGKSPREIMLILNAEGVPGPKGKVWHAATIRGDRKLGLGILNNEIYRGKLIYGRLCYVRDPKTGKRRPRSVPRSQWLVQDAPDLRIVDQALWERVQRRRRAGGNRTGGRRVTRPFTGLVRCALCAGPMTTTDRNRYRCLKRRTEGACENKRGISMEELERRSADELLEWVTTERYWDVELEAGAAALERRRAGLGQAVAESRARIEHLREAMHTHDAQTAATHKRLLALERTCAVFELERNALPPAVTLAPSEYAARLETRLTALHRQANNVLQAEAVRRDAQLRLRKLIAVIVIAPDYAAGRYAVKLDIEVRREGLVALALECRSPD